MRHSVLWVGALRWIAPTHPRNLAPLVKTKADAMSQNLKWTKKALADFRARGGIAGETPPPFAALSPKVTPPEVWPKRNKWEMQFEEYLRNGEGTNELMILPQALTFRLARATSYTPDIIMTDQEGGGNIIAYEVKGFWRQSGRIKIKMAARLFPFVTFIAVTRPKGQGWQFERISA